MNRTILYYPTIDIPKDSWLRHALLYWDEVSSIVPKSRDGKLLIELSPNIQYLMDEEQFRPIIPEELITKFDNREVFEDFQNEFKEIVSAQQFRNFINRPRFRGKSRIHENKILPNSRIHSNKTSDSIYYFLEEQGLAQRNGHNEWIRFEKNTALLYMSLLAKYLADIDINQTTIGTDYAIYEKYNFKRVSKEKGFPVVSFNLDRVLPTPKDNVPFEKIIDFKRKREANLSHFKKTLSDFQSKISYSKSNAEMKEIAINFQEALVNGVEDLTAVLKDGKIAHTIKSMKSLINLKSPTSITAVGSIFNNQIDLINIPIGLNIAGVAIVGAIELRANYVEARNMQRAQLRENPFSYIHYAHRHGIINRPR